MHATKPVIGRFRRGFVWAQRYEALAFLLPVLVFTPSLLQYLGIASSLALGTCLAALPLILAFAGRQHLPSRLTWNEGATLWVRVTLLLTVMFLHLLTAALIQPVDFARACLSVIPLLLVLAAGYGLGHLLVTTRSADVERAVNIAFVLLCATGLSAISGFTPMRSEAYFKPVFPYTEPSHFALVFVPLLMFVCVQRRGLERLVVLMGGLGFAWLLESLTLMAGWILVATVCLSKKTLLLLFAAIVPLAAQLDLTYYLDRLNFGGDGQNLSTLVYVQGWQLLSESLQQTTGFGLGFQQMGVYGTNVASADAIYSLIGDNANLLDGGFLLAKIGGEFGVFGFLIVLLYFRIALSSARALRRQSLSGSYSPAINLARCVVVSFMLELLVRGAGYFSGTTILLVAGLTILSKGAAVRPAIARVYAHTGWNTLTITNTAQRSPSGPKR